MCKNVQANHGRSAQVTYPDVARARFDVWIEPTSAHHTSSPEDEEAIHRSGSDPGVSDVPTWRIGDKWIYAGAFDPSILITDTGVSATVGEIQGDSTAEVTDILELQFDNRTEWVYKLRMTADFDKSGVELEGYTGNAEIQFTQTEYLRVSDFATVKNDLDLYQICSYGIGSLTQILEILPSPTYSPATEAYDFPLRYGERWTSLTTSSSTWSDKVTTSHRSRLRNRYEHNDMGSNGCRQTTKFNRCWNCLQWMRCVL